MSIVYSPPFIATLVRFFTRGDEEVLSKLKQTLLEKVHEIQQKLYEEIKSVVRTQKTADVAFQLHLPQITLPESPEHDDGPAIIIQGNLPLYEDPNTNTRLGGLLKLESEPRKPKKSKLDPEGVELRRVMDSRARWRAAHAHHDAMQRDLLGAHDSHTSHTLHSVRGVEAVLSRPASASASATEMWYYDGYAASWEGFGVHLVVPVMKVNTAVSASEHATSSSQSSSVAVATPVSLLAPTGCQLLLEVCALPYNIDLPQIVLCGHISPLQFHVTREHMVLLGRIAASLGLMDEPAEDTEAELQGNTTHSSMGVRVKKRSTMEMFDIMTDVKDLYAFVHCASFLIVLFSIKTRKHTHEKLQNCILMQGQITLPLVTGTFGYKEGSELRIVASRVAVGAVTGVFHMDTELRVYELSIIALFSFAIQYSTLTSPGVTDTRYGELIKFSHPVNPVTPSDIFSMDRHGKVEVGSDIDTHSDINSDTGRPGMHEEGSDDERIRSLEDDDMYNPISETIESETRHPTHQEASRIVVNTTPVAPFLTCRIRNVARNSLEYDYTDYFLDTTLGPCQIAVHQDIVVSCLKVYYLAMAEALKRYFE